MNGNQESAGDQVALFGLAIDRLTMAQTVGRLMTWIGQDGFSCRYVVTPNLDHAVRIPRDADLQAAYATASLVVADGWPIVWASRLLRTPLPERVAGSDLVPALFAAATYHRPLRVYFLGAMPGVAERAGQRVMHRWPQVLFVGCDSPPPGFERDPTENDQIVARINQVRPDLLVVGLGSPKQEIWLHRHAGRLDCRVAIAAGATIDFLAGAQTRAPRWLQALNLEWLYRAVRDPKRLARRYLYDAAMFPGLLWHQFRTSSERA